MQNFTLRCWTAVLAAIVLTAGGAAWAQSGSTQGTAERIDTTTAGSDKADAQQQVDEATRVVKRMKQDPQLLRLLERAQGVFIVPSYGKAAAVVGGRGGEGVLLVRRQNDEWSSPAFYDFGGLSVGAQVGGAAGSVAMLLMNDKAVSAFRTEKDNFAVNANAGLTLLDYSAGAGASAGKGDIIVWSDTEGLFAGVSIGITDVRRDDEDNRAYYTGKATPQEIFAGSVTNPQAQPLLDALPDRMAAR